MGGGIGIANNLITTQDGFALDARQGKILNEYITKVNDDLLKMIRATGRLDGNNDWNNFLDPGVYKVQNAVMTAENHAPVGASKYGILVVLVAETGGERRRKQIYFPNMPYNANNIIMAARQYNIETTEFTDAGWQPWYAVQGTLLAA